MIAVVVALTGPLGHEHFCRECADRAAAVLVGGGAAIPAWASTTPAALVATPFTLSEARLTEGPTSLEWQAQQTNLAYLLMLNVSSLAYNFRNTSHLPLHNATPFGGWETPYGPYGDDRGHFTGHYLSAAALAANATGNTELRARSKELVRALAECQAANAAVYPKFGPGYLHASPTTYFDCLENLWRRPCRYMQVPYYNVHKIMQGLLDQHILLGNAEAFEMVKQMAAYFFKRIRNVLATNGTEVWERVINTETGGMNDLMYKLYSLTADADHLTMAHLFDKPNWFEPMVNGSIDVLGGRHANTHLALSVGGAQRFVSIGDPSYRTATSFLYDTLRSAHSYSTGGSNFREYWQTAHEQGSSILSVARPDRFAGHDTEESCTTYNFLKIIRHLFEWSAAPALLEMYNYALNNGVLGIQRGTVPGVMLYLMPLGVGVTKGNSSRGWGTPFHSFWCCYGTAVESFSKLADSIYFHEAATGSLIVARYVDSSLTPASKSDIALHQSSSVAHTGTATLTIDAVGSTADTLDGALYAAESTIKLLIPSWALSPSVLINGVAPAAVPMPGSFLALQRAWSVGDRIELTLPCTVSLTPIDDQRPPYRTMFSFVFGDTLLVGLAPSASASATLPIPSDVPPEQWVKTAVRRVKGAALRFVVSASDSSTVVLMPLNEVIDERYTVYYNLTAHKSNAVTS